MCENSISSVISRVSSVCPMHDDGMYFDISVRFTAWDGRPAIYMDIPSFSFVFIYGKSFMFFFVYFVF